LLICASEFPILRTQSQVKIRNDYTGISLTIIGGNLFSGSLEIVARAFRDSQLRMDALAFFFGEVHFGRTTQLIRGAIEGALFGCMVMAGMEVASRETGEMA